MSIDASKPAWFNRVYALARQRQAQGQCNYWDPDLPITPSNFDEDISDCSSDGSCASAKGCKFNEDDECTIHGYDGEESDSSTGSNASGLDLEYYEMKMQRYERKLELKNQKRDRKKTTKEEFELEASHMREARKIFEESKAKKHKEPTALTSLKDRKFTLWSVDHLQYAPKELQSPKFIEFYPMDASDQRETPFMGHMATGTDSLCLEEFIQPKNVSRNTYKLRADEGEGEVQIKFFHDNYLGVRITRDLVYINEPNRVPKDAPEFFFYWGICDDYTLAQSRRDKEEKPRRSASPE
ncbi:hypothetical protein ACHAQK_008170 [Fusarium lateritium]